MSHIENLPGIHLFSHRVIGANIAGADIQREHLERSVQNDLCRDFCTRLTKLVHREEGSEGKLIMSLDVYVLTKDEYVELVNRANPIPPGVDHGLS
jgi:hypothetical protein